MNPTASTAPFTHLAAVQKLPGEGGVSRVHLNTMPGTLDVECHDEAVARTLARGLLEHYDHLPVPPLPPHRGRATLSLEPAMQGVWPPIAEADWRRIDDRPQRDGRVRGLAYEHVQEYLDPAAGAAEFVTRDGSCVRVAADQSLSGYTTPADRARGDGGMRVLRDLVACAFTRVWREWGYFVLHCSVVLGPDGACRLFPASSGSGKSALLLAMVRHGGLLVGDDKLIMREETSADGTTQIRGYPMQRFVNLTQDVTEYWPSLAFLREERSSPTWPKVRIDMQRVGLGDAPLPVCVPSRILFPEVVEGAEQTELQAVSPIDAVDLLLTQSVVSLEPAHASAHLALLARLATDCRCLRLLGGMDVMRTPVEFCEWLMRETA